MNWYRPEDPDETARIEAEKLRGATGERPRRLTLNDSITVEVSPDGSVEIEYGSPETGHVCGITVSAEEWRDIFEFTQRKEGSE